MRAAGIRHQWKIAKALSPSLQPEELRGWFSAYLGADETPPALMTQLLWLIEVRAQLREAHNLLPVQRVNSAIWVLAQAIRAQKHAGSENTG